MLTIGRWARELAAVREPRGLAEIGRRMLSETRVFTKLGSVTKSAPASYFGVLLKPDDPDSQGDIVKSADIDGILAQVRKAIDAGELEMGEEHEGGALSSLKATRAYKLHKSAEMGGEEVPAGSIILRFEATGRIQEEIEKGEFGGISLEGRGVRVRKAERVAKAVDTGRLKATLSGCLRDVSGVRKALYRASSHDRDEAPRLLALESALGPAEAALREVVGKL